MQVPCFILELLILLKCVYLVVFLLLFLGMVNGINARCFQRARLAFFFTIFLHIDFLNCKTETAKTEF